MLLKGSAASSDARTQLANDMSKFVRLADHNASAEWPGIKTEIPQKKHGQREQKFPPVMFHGRDIQSGIRSRHQRGIEQFDQAGIPKTQAPSGYARPTPAPASVCRRGFQTFWG